MYTDGVTEATDLGNNLYGMERLEAALNQLTDLPPEDILHAVKEDIDAFVGEAPQFDDITMLCLTYIRRMKGENGEESGAHKLTLPATLKNIAAATKFMNDVLDSAGCSASVKKQLDVALDELMSNVARYAYAPGTGDITVSVEILEDPKRAVIALSDYGEPYNPLKNVDPDVTLPAEDREIGGLGVFIVKETMDDVTYEYREKQNIITIVKNL